MLASLRIAECCNAWSFDSYVFRNYHQNQMACQNLQVPGLACTTHDLQRKKRNTRNCCCDFPTAICQLQGCRTCSDVEVVCCLLLSWQNANLSSLWADSGCHIDVMWTLLHQWSLRTKRPLIMWKKCARHITAPEERNHCWKTEEASYKTAAKTLNYRLQVL